MLVIAKDKGEPSKKSDNTATVTVTVDRNKNAPEFLETDKYEATINENTRGGTEVFRLTYRDTDQVVRFCSFKCQNSHS